MSTLSETGALRGQTRAGGLVLLVTPQGQDVTGVADALRGAGFEVVATADPAEAERLGRECRPDLAVVDAEVAAATVGVEEWSTAAILLGAEGSESVGPQSVFVDALGRSAGTDRLLAAARFAAELGRVSRRAHRLERELATLRADPGLVGCSPIVRRLSTVLSRVAESDATVLIEGKPGTGKTLAAQIIHAHSRRSDLGLSLVPCASIDEQGMTNLLRGVDGGTLVLEDVDQLPAAAQAVLVRFLKERTGSEQEEQPNVRLLATTSARIPELVARGSFREDLYYRLSSFPVVIPALHERREDIALLAMHFLKQACLEAGCPVVGFTPTAMILLESHPWPGNAAQLRTAILRAHCLSGAGPIDRGHLLGPATGLDPEPEIDPDRRRRWESDEVEATEEDIVPMEEEEKRLLTRALKATRGNVRRASQLLGIGRATLYRKIQIYKLKLN